MFVLVLVLVFGLIAGCRDLREPMRMMISMSE